MRKRDKSEKWNLSSSLSFEVKWCGNFSIFLVFILWNALLWEANNDFSYVYMVTKCRQLFPHHFITIWVLNLRITSTSTQESIGCDMKECKEKKKYYKTKNVNESLPTSFHHHHLRKLYTGHLCLHRFYFAHS